MNALTLESFTTLIEHSSIKPRLKRDLRFITNTVGMTDDDWHDSEMVAIKDRTDNKGVLLVSISSGMYVLPFELKQIAKSSTTGRAQPVICDFCRTWQSGSRAGSITFTGAKKSSTNVGYLCCLDLDCSKHVRTKTSAAKVSRAQLREDLDNEQRVDRLNNCLEKLMVYLQVTPVTTT